MQVTILAVALGATFLSSSAGMARAAEPLLVVVEAGREAELSPDEVRAAIATEIEARVLGPREAWPAPEADPLVVAVDARWARLVYQPAGAPARQRRIELPRSRDERLETIAWLALNLVTDQVADPPFPSGGTATVAVPPPLTDASAALEPAPVTAPAAVVPSAPASTFGEASVVATKASTAEPASSSWSVSVSGGPTVHPFMRRMGWRWMPWRSGNEWQVEASRAMGGWSVGMALDLGDSDIPYGGVAVLVGDGWRWRKLQFEGTVGAGLELGSRQVSRTTASLDSTGGYSYSIEVSGQPRLRPYGRANATLAWRIRRTVDLMLRVGLHVASDDKYYSYGAAMLGLRLHLP